MLSLHRSFKFLYMQFELDDKLGLQEGSNVTDGKNH